MRNPRPLASQGEASILSAPRDDCASYWTPGLGYPRLKGNDKIPGRTVAVGGSDGRWVRGSAWREALGLPVWTLPPSRIMHSNYETARSNPGLRTPVGWPRSWLKRGRGNLPMCFVCVFTPFRRNPRMVEPGGENGPSGVGLLPRVRPQNVDEKNGIHSPQGVGVLGSFPAWLRFTPARTGHSR